MGRCYQNRLVGNYTFRRCRFQLLECYPELDHSLTEPSESKIQDAILGDQVCIDQTSTADKEAQIALMARIYGQAKRVFAWIGPQAEDTELTMHIFRLDLKKEANRNIIKASSGTSGACPAGNHMLTEETYHERISNSLRDFFAREYWTRCWILQEITHPASDDSRIFIHCGEQRIVLIRTDAPFSGHCTLD